MDIEAMKYVKDVFTEAGADDSGKAKAKLVVRFDIPGKPGSRVWKEAFQEASGIVEAHGRIHPNATVKFVDMAGFTIAP